MINFGSKIMRFRRQNGWSQEELAHRIDSSRVMVSTCEREENSPSVEVLVRLAKLFDGSFNLLLGEGTNAAYHKDMVKRFEAVEVLSVLEKERIFNYIDLVIRDFRTSQAYAG